MESFLTAYFLLSQYLMKAFLTILVHFAGIVLTNDGNAILRELDVSHPAAKVSTDGSESLAMQNHLFGMF